MYKLEIRNLFKLTKKKKNRNKPRSRTQHSKSYKSRIKLLFMAENPFFSLSYVMCKNLIMCKTNMAGPVYQKEFNIGLLLIPCPKSSTTLDFPKLLLMLNP